MVSGSIVKIYILFFTPKSQELEFILLSSEPMLFKLVKV